MKSDRRLLADVDMHPALRSSLSSILDHIPCRMTVMIDEGKLEFVNFSVVDRIDSPLGTIRLLVIPKKPNDSFPTTLEYDSKTASWVWWRQFEEGLRKDKRVFFPKKLVLVPADAITYVNFARHEADRVGVCEDSNRINSWLFDPETETSLLVPHLDSCDRCKVVIQYLRDYPGRAFDYELRHLPAS